MIDERPLTPGLPFYQPAADECAVFETAHANGLPLLLKGPTGCGKTRFVKHMAARLDLPLHTVACHDDLSAADLIGRYLLKGGICYLDEVVEARRDVTVVLHPLTDERRRLVIDRTGEELHAPASFMLVASYNPGYQNILKKLKPSTRQRFLSIGFDFPLPEVEMPVVARESGLDEARTTALVRLAGKIRGLSGMDLEEGVSTRLFIYAATMIAGGMSVDRALEAAIIGPLSDEPGTQQALRDLAAVIYG